MFEEIPPESARYDDDKIRPGEHHRIGPLRSRRNCHPHPDRFQEIQWESGIYGISVQIATVDDRPIGPIRSRSSHL